MPLYLLIYTILLFVVCSLMTFALSRTSIRTKAQYDQARNEYLKLHEENYICYLTAYADLFKWVSKLHEQSPEDAELQNLYNVIHSNLAKLEIQKEIIFPTFGTEKVKGNKV
jgi:hypothetical protein